MAACFSAASRSESSDRRKRRAVSAALVVADLGFESESVVEVESMARELLALLLNGQTMTP